MSRATRVFPCGQMQAITFSPSFSSYSSGKLEDIAARVVEEFGVEDLYGEICFQSVEEGEFEFEFATNGSESSAISADEIFDNGKILPIFPVLCGDLVLESGVGADGKEEGAKTIRLPLSKLFGEEREATATSWSSSSDADKLQGIPEGTYCVWRPKSAAAASLLKSSSTGSVSKKWRLIDLQHRSRNKGSKVTAVSLSPVNSGRKRETDGKIEESPLSPVRAKSAAPPYHRDGGEKRRTYLPYRQDLVGLFSSKNSPHH